MSTRSLESKLSSFRKRRSLLNRAYRAARRAGNRAYRSRRYGHTASDHFLKAAEIQQMGEASGLQVGGILDGDRLRSMAVLKLAQEKATIDRLLNAKPESTVARPQVERTPTALSIDNDDETEYVDPSLVPNPNLTY